MKALILAAGVGSRLKPLTNDTPKALIPVAGTPMLERVMTRLMKAGVANFVVNAHAHADQIVAACADLSRRLGVGVTVSREDEQLLDTGGAIKKAAPYLEGHNPIFIHNVDILTDLDLGLLYSTHLRNGALATLAVRDRDSSRAYLFDRSDHFVGHDDRVKAKTTWSQGPLASALRLGFDGVHVVSPELLPLLSESGAFSITAAYLRLAGLGADIRAFRTDSWNWHDIGTTEKLAAAEHWLSYGAMI